MEEEESEKRAVRIFVGGLGEAVTTDDIRKLFESLGSVQSLETIRTKGRSLAYLDFLADSKSLSKLFSKYNGCVWKGGKLKLEKAKEHYLDRLKKEWEEDAILSIEPPASDVSTHKEDLVKEKPNARRFVDPDAKPLNIYFPRLRTVKSIPFSGTGKHKYSFQNIKVGPLPVHFCDCEEHCSPFIAKKDKLSMNGETEREKLSMSGEAEIGGINDEEINIMNAVMNKLLEKEKVSNTKHLGKKHDSFESLSVIHSNECEVDSATDDGDDDDDDLITNIATKKNKAALTGTQELERIMESQEWSNKTNIAEEEPIEAQKRSKSDSSKVKKRKSLPKSESESNGVASSTPVGKSKMQTLLDGLGSGAKPTEPEHDFGESAKVSWSQKSSWRELVGKGGNASFSASLILPKFDSAEDQQNSDGSYTSSSTNDETEDMESDEYPESEPSDTKVIEEPAESQPTNTQVIKEHAEAQPTNTRVIEEPAEAQPTNKQVITEPADTQHNIAPKITGTGVSWWQKKSWTQLANENNSPFSLSQLLPDISFPEQTAKEPILYPAGSSECKHNGADKNTVDGTVTDGFNLGEIVPENSEHAGTNIVSAPVVEKIVETGPRERSANVEIGETCSFMRSADSLKEWKKAKAAVSGSLKRKRGEKK